MLARPGDRAALLPEVLADGQGEGGTGVAQDRGALAGDEVAALVEDSVVGQVMLDVAGHHVTVVQHGGSIHRRAARAAGDAEISIVEMIEVAHDADEFAQAVVIETAGEIMQAGDRGILEGRTQGEILDGVAGQGHLGEEGHVGAALLGKPSLAPHQCRIAGQIADDRVHLGEGEADPGHARRLPPAELTHS